jgi:MOSC domain-containing protein YiiM|tara:strand:- start:594 stop:1019 length:426 start_codon:yes stop_codon:yes gene_type:complete
MTVKHLFTQPAHGVSPEPAEQLELVMGGGAKGDQHEHRKTRALVIMSLSDVNLLGLKPGDLREQITLDLPELMSLKDGTLIKIGGVEIRIDGDCDPCVHIGELLGIEDREAFRNNLLGHRGKLATVLNSGIIAISDKTELA